MRVLRVSRPAVVRAALLLAAAVAIGGDAAAQSCDADHTIRWPESNPIWQLCWISPEDSSGIDGSGLEIADVRYNGRLVLARGHIPVLNVKYDPGGCGGFDLSYRDWSNQLVRFDADNVIRPGYAEPTVPPRTVCDNPGTDVGSFSGVAAEKLADRLILSTQVQAGWYRYIHSWTFFADGTIKPMLRFTAVDNVCTPLAHYHNVYFRFDFDLDGVENDAVDEYNAGVWSAVTTEAQRLHSPATSRRWRVRDKTTGSGYEIVPGPAADIANAWSVADAWSLLYRSGEEDDGGATGGLDGDRAHIDRYVSGDSIDARDVVFWYRVGYRHDGPADCEIGGPTLQPVRLPAVAVSANGERAPITVRALDPLRIDLRFDADASGTLNPGEVYVGVAGPSGVFFVDPAAGFVITPTPLYAGPLASFGPLPFVDLPAAGALPPGTYVWFLIVDGDTNGVVNGTYFDYVVTSIIP